ncbi:hypothetical protein RAA17_21395 [Komagataeibacter rhaeticus]|nr:hypothetical protein [Komagataeibacter rhaeticus]
MDGHAGAVVSITGSVCMTTPWPASYVMEPDRRFHPSGWNRAWLFTPC